ncbi:MAG: Spy/CpxP family protein refolding chaperone [Desulfobacteraceae bacterium]|nr:Spy/CpxP family protein refolding chaperone [Desulfobacteraceae bacterium]
MKLKKKYVIVGSVVAFLVLGAGFCIVKASGDYGFCGRGFHPPFSKKAFPECILKHMDKKMEELNLSEEQKKKYAQLKASFKADFEEMRSRRHKFMNEIKAEIDQQNPDMQRLADTVKDRLKQMPDRIGTHLDQLVDFYNILDEEQKTRVLERMRERMARCEKIMSEK